MRSKTQTLGMLLAFALISCIGLDAYSQDAPKPADDKAEAADEPDIVLDENGNLLPKHFNEKTQEAIELGMAFLARNQTPDGSFRNSRDGATYPVTMTSLAGMAFIAGGNTTSRGPYADNVKKAVRYILAQADPNTGIIAAGTENGRTMYPHGFAMLFLSSVYGMESNEAVRDRMKTVIEKGIKLIGSAQSNLGGWYYTPNSGDEGSVTVTQLQALRAAHNAGFVVPEDVIEKAIQYLEMCRTPEGGIRYSFNSGNSTRLPISAAALPCIYSTGDYESEMAEACLEYVFKSYCLNGNDKSWNKNGGHDFYGHYYASQAFYQAGDEYWDTYFPVARDQLLQMQGQGGEGAWNGDGVGPVYGTAMALTILQLPYKYLPIYQR
ncbi:MAG: terpene cyclase/mutase family protein [Phycisphaeraceae bacterium]|nr:terpene cyclase/mutase family protein [Phycisphaeraceae bacterium]